MAMALGVDIPPLGEEVQALASTGLLHRVLALSSLDYRNSASFEVANRLLEEAASMRRAGTDDQ